MVTTRGHYKTSRRKRRQNKIFWKKNSATNIFRHKPASREKEFRHNFATSLISKNWDKTPRQEIWGNFILDKKICDLVFQNLVCYRKNACNVKMRRCLYFLLNILFGFVSTFMSWAALKPALRLLFPDFELKSTSQKFQILFQSLLQFICKKVFFQYFLLRSCCIQNFVVDLLSNRRA
mgnify:CR=1 FL=1